MRKRLRQSRAHRQRHSSRVPVRILALAIGSGLLAGAVIGTLRSRSHPLPEAHLDPPRAVTARPVATPVALSDDDLQRAADELLGAVNPELPENAHFTAFAKEKLRWMSREHAAGRLTVAFFVDTESIDLPSDVMMAATRLDGQHTILIAKPRFATFLSEGARATARSVSSRRTISRSA